ncbi:SdrD B-like domain-containing protein [Psychrobacillus sp.]|uniref:SdrD B-like domain-containing protein n=1 Tax=Psychrobacillus sp. TaxID=1871623 RepID=UPI0028BF1F59|nr:SdrD B-like domain-containing protein [Psychrobacillus sp.]
MNNRISIFLVGLMVLQLLLPSLAAPIQAATSIPGLTFEKTSSKSVVNVGETFTYSIAYSVVDSSRNGQEITIVDTIPSQFEILEGDWTFRNGQTLTFGPEMLTSGTAGQFDIEVKARPTGVNNAVQTTNTASVTVVDTNEMTTSSAIVTINTDPNSSSIGNYVWIDTNEDGNQDDGERGINDVDVKLYNSVKQFIAQTKTKDNAGHSGYYKFVGLPQGTYYLQFIVPTGYRFTKVLNENPDSSAFDSTKTDSNGMTDAIVVSAGEEKEMVDVGMVQLPGKIGNYVWIDANKNGIQDAGEPGIGGVNVKLYDSGKNAIKTTTTDSSGYYRFEGLPQGTYYVQFTVPTDYKFTKSEAATPENDSNKIDGNGMTDAIIIGPQSWRNETIDVGMVPLGTIGNYVWIDTNEDGIQDAGESGINGIDVKLYDSAKQLAKQTTTTDNAGQSGYYAFKGLPQGTYFVQFIVPKDYKFTKSEAATSENDSNKIDGTGMTDAIVIGQQSWRNETIDAGLVAKRIPSGPSVPSGNSGGSTQKARFSDISGHWAEATIKKALSDGIAKGYTDGTFRPDAKVTRAEFMAMWMNAQILETEITRGYRYKTFRPSASMSRLELEVLIARAAGIDRDSAATMIELGIVNGSNGNLFASDETITRAEAITLIMKLIQTK